MVDRRVKVVLESGDIGVGNDKVVGHQVPEI